MKERKFTLSEDNHRDRHVRKKQKRKLCGVLLFKKQFFLIKYKTNISFIIAVLGSEFGK